jgi:hypothetical protein
MKTNVRFSHFDFEIFRCAVSSHIVCLYGTKLNRWKNCCAPPMLKTIYKMKPLTLYWSVPFGCAANKRDFPLGFSNFGARSRITKPGGQFSLGGKQNTNIQYFENLRWIYVSKFRFSLRWQQWPVLRTKAKTEFLLRFFVYLIFLVLVCSAQFIELDLDGKHMKSGMWFGTVHVHGRSEQSFFWRKNKVGKLCFKRAFFWWF